MRDYEVTQHTWSANVSIGGNPGPRLFVVTLIEKEMEELCKEYYRVDDTTGEWKPIRAPRDDVVECAKVILNRI